MSGEFDDLIREAAARYNLDPARFRRQLVAESNLDPGVVNPTSGAAGIGQFMPATARGLGIDPMDPRQAIPAAARLMRSHLTMFGGDYDKALAAYNWGPGNVRSKGMENMPAETRNYLAKINGTGGAAVGAPLPVPPVPPAMIPPGPPPPPTGPEPTLLPPPPAGYASLGDMFMSAAKRAQGIA